MGPIWTGEQFLSEVNSAKDCFYPDLFWIKNN
jgi:hypothetical protein